MGIFGLIVSTILYVLMLPFLLIGAVGALISHLLVSGGEKVDRAATGAVGESYTRPRNALLKLVVGTLILGAVIWVASLALSGSADVDCDYGRNGAQCYPG
jgi:hypothetical protein